MTVLLQEQETDLEEIRVLGVPRHVAIIMDGNRRWARQRGFFGVYGHWRGAEVINPLVRYASTLGIEVLTLYSFSTENWARSKEEVEELMKVISFYLKENRQFMIEESVRLRTIGDVSTLPPDLQRELRQTEEITAKGHKIQLVLALNYGGRDEIRRAFLRIMEDVDLGKITKKDISESLISGYLDTAELGDPDLLIRTSGEQRLSNFLLWQMSYTEVYVTRVLWPDFTQGDLLEAVKEFQKRNRRLGGG